MRLVKAAAEKPPEHPGKSCAGRAGGGGQGEAADSTGRPWLARRFLLDSVGRPTDQWASRNPCVLRRNTSKAQ